MSHPKNPASDPEETYVGVEDDKKNPPMFPPPTASFWIAAVVAFILLKYP